LANRLAAALVLVALVAVAIGCGGEAGVSDGATVSVYVAAPLCPAAQQALADAGGRAGEFRVRARCLGETEAQGRLDLAATGDGARRASEDSTTVAYVEADGPAARFARPILESAGIVWVPAGNGAAAMHRILRALAAAGGGSLRDDLRQELG
jgi:hypothetical protein